MNFGTGLPEVAKVLDGMAIRLGQDNHMYQYSIQCFVVFPERVQILHIGSESTDFFSFFFFRLVPMTENGELLYLGDF